MHEWEHTPPLATTVRSYKYQLNASWKDKGKAWHVKFYAVLGSDISYIINQLSIFTKLTRGYTSASKNAMTNTTPHTNTCSRIHQQLHSMHMHTHTYTQKR